MLEFRPFRLGSDADAGVLFALLQQASDYSLLVEGRRPTLDDAIKELSALPPGKPLQDKCFGGYWVDGALIGCMDLIRGYPEPDIAYLGLLLFASAHRGAGHGVAALSHLSDLARSWGCARMRLAVIDKNVRGLRFWRREGFAELYRKPTVEYTGDAIVLQRTL